MAAEHIPHTAVDAPVTVERLTVAIVAADIPVAASTVVAVVASMAVAVADSTAVAVAAVTQVAADTAAVVTGKLLSIQSERDGLRLVPFSFATDFEATFAPCIFS